MSFTLDQAAIAAAENEWWEDFGRAEMEADLQAEADYLAEQDLHYSVSRPTGAHFYAPDDGLGAMEADALEWTVRERADRYR